MAGSSATVPAARRVLTWRPPVAPGGAGIGWLPVWSAPAAIRALRATIVIPAVFALTFKAIGDLQMAMFAVFGGFATLVMASFGGTRRDRAIAHLGLAVAGSAALAIGTAVSGTAWLAALVTLPVTFAIFFAGVAGPNAAAGVTATLLAYVLPVASPGAAGMIPDRLAGWWLASAVSTAAVLLISPRTPGDKLRAAAAGCASALSDYLAAGLRVAQAGAPDTTAVNGAAPGALSAALPGGQSTALPGGQSPAATASAPGREAAIAAKHTLMNTFAATPYRPTGLAAPDQALASLVQLLEWCAALICDATDGHAGLGYSDPPDRELLRLSADTLADVAAVLSGADVVPGLAALDAAHQASVDHQRDLTGEPGRVRACSAHSVHAQAIGAAVRTAAIDALIAVRRADPQTIAAVRYQWSNRPATRFPALAGAAGFIADHASLRSVWFLNSARGAAALAAAVAVADLTGVQHGFWVVLGTLSVLRTSAAATGATAMRALAGTGAGFIAGAALVLAVGTDPAALWVALPLAVLVAAYAPGTAPFAVGQAAFTVTVVVLFNLLVPAGWQVGLLRVQDVALGCIVSLLVGALFWPRGAAAVVGDDLADAFRFGGEYLTQSVDWALGLRASPPDGGSAATAGMRLDDALRGYLTEQGTKQVSKEDLWHLVMATLRIRLTAQTVAGLRTADGPPWAPPVDSSHPGVVLSRRAAELAGFYEQIAQQVGPVGRQVLPWQAQQPKLAAPALAGQPALIAAPSSDGQHSLGDHPHADHPHADHPHAHHPHAHHPHALWVREHLHHLGSHAPVISGPAARRSAARHGPWWR